MEKKKWSRAPIKTPQKRGEMQSTTQLPPDREVLVTKKTNQRTLRPEKTKALKFWSKRTEAQS